MKKIKKKAKNKKQKTKTAKKGSSPRTTKHEIVVRVQSEVQKPQLPALTEADLTPVQEGGKYMIPKTWLTEKQALKIIQKTPSQYILKRKGKGGMMFDYIPGHYFKKVLNYTFGWNWDFKIIKQEVFGIGESWAQVVTTGELTVKDDHGHTITKADNGKADIKLLKESKKPMDIGNDFKASATDCLKRCAAQLGIGSDVYGKMDIKHDTDYDVPPNLPAIGPASQTPKENGKLKPGQVIGPDGYGVYLCSETGDIISDAEYAYSMKMFGKALSRDAQKNHKKK